MEELMGKLMRLEGKVAVVTGGASGMGKATALLFAREGAKVAVFDVDESGLEAMRSELPEGLMLNVDVSDSKAVDAGFEQVKSTLGPVDVVFNPAALDDTKVKADVAKAMASGQPTNITMEMTDEQWRRTISVNLDGTFYVTRAALRQMIPRESGSIITVSSTGGLIGGPPVNYCAAKGGVLGFTRAVAKEVWSRNIRVNSIAPGPIDTPMMRRNPRMSSPPPGLGRFGKPEEIATTALFLATDDSSFITGETIIVSGPLLTI
jgi:NAD(P)-dependent dehydrogenase (short-subunit alcohol dehydrogenase family)